MTVRRLASVALAAFLQLFSAQAADPPPQTAGLIDLAVKDLIANGSDPQDFRDVGIGTFVSRDNTDKLLLCGDVEIVPGGQAAVWAAFAVTETDPYELVLGGNATGTCSADHVEWLAVDDLAPAFQQSLKDIRAATAD